MNFLMEFLSPGHFKYAGHTSGYMGPEVVQANAINVSVAIIILLY